MAKKTETRTDAGAVQRCAYCRCLSSGSECGPHVCYYCAEELDSDASSASGRGPMTDRSSYTSV